MTTAMVFQALSATCLLIWIVLIAIYFKDIKAYFFSQWWVPAALMWNLAALLFAGLVLAVSPGSLSYKLLLLPFTTSFVFNAAFTRSHSFAVLNLSLAGLTLYTSMCLDGQTPT